MCTMLYKLSLKGCTTLNQIFNQLVLQSFETIVQYIVQQKIYYCTTLDNMYNNVQNLVQFSFQTHFSVVQLFKFFIEYNLLYNIVQLMYNVLQYCTGCTGCTTFCTIL